MAVWGEWEPRTDNHASAYVDWEVDMMRKLGLFEDMHMVAVPAKVADSPLRFPRFFEVINAELDAFASPQDPRPQLFPVPRAMANPHFTNGEIRASTETQRSKPEGLSKDTVVIGVIDLDVGIGHSRFRNSDGSSRVLAAWQQGMDWSEKRQEHLPFGQELSKTNIKELLEECGSRDIDQRLDQEAFYRKVGLLQHDRLEGMGGLGQTAAHGTHVMGLAAGADPCDEDFRDFRDNVKMIVANLPHPCCFGEGGAFLDYFLTYASRWIIETNNKLSEKISRDHTFPLFINVSFGKQAGARGDGRTFQSELIETRGRRKRLGVEPPTVFLPAGNDNLARCHAHLFLNDEPRELEWRIQPDDGTSNFLEIWVENDFSKSEVDSGFGGRFPLLIDVIPPGMDEAELTEPSSPFKRDLADGVGRIYCDVLENIGAAKKISDEARDDSGERYKLRYLVCLSPNGINFPGEKTAPAGKYRVKLTNQFKGELSIVAKIQTDEATIQTFRNAKRSYFEDANYRMFEYEGRIGDTYLYTGDIENGHSLDRSYSPIKRHGSMNSYAATNSVTAVAGYRLSDGRPAPYSGSGIGPLKNVYSKDDQKRLAPTAAFPSDDGYAHFGILSDGAQDGSVVAMRGTSFACALATRYAVDAFLADRQKVNDPPKIWETLRTVGAREKTHGAWLNAEVDPEKAGRGRILARRASKVDRMRGFED